MGITGLVGGSACNYKQTGDIKPIRSILSTITKLMTEAEHVCNGVLNNGFNDLILENYKELSITSLNYKQGQKWGVCNAV